ncbi:hypothetical protein [Lysinibacillus xylanilyticus]|uniref:hypothetical protein n=1 Tax=Lysinibacillus xylanilyticus TaxID=582475 RepID=UPI003824290C
MVIDEECFVQWQNEVNNQFDKAKELVDQYDNISKQYNKLLKKLTLILNNPSSITIDKKIQDINSNIIELTGIKSIETANLEKLKTEEKSVCREVNIQIEKINQIEGSLEKIQ